MANTWHTYLLATMSIQILTLFSRLSAMEMPLEMLHEGVKVPKSTDYARRMAFPLVAAADASVEVPPSVEDSFNFAPTSGGSDEPEEFEGTSTTGPDMSQWLQLQQGHYHQHQPAQANSFHNPLQQKHKHTKHHNANRQVHTSTTSPASSPLRRCSIEISSKIPGICQSMGSIGNACVSGDYIDVFNVECL